MGGWAQNLFLSRQFTSRNWCSSHVLWRVSLKVPLPLSLCSDLLQLLALDPNSSTLCLALCYSLILGTVSSSMFLQFNIFWITERGYRCLVLPKTLMVLRGTIHLQNYFLVSWVQPNGKLMRPLPWWISYTKLSHYHWEKKKAWKVTTEISITSHGLCPQGRT